MERKSTGTVRILKNADNEPQWHGALARGGRVRPAKTLPSPRPAARRRWR
jgi:hypothetical protein